MDENEIDDTAPTGTTVSDTLRQERERQGMSRADLSDRTKISERHLIAIDEGDFSAMPSRTYIIGFVRSYANALGPSSSACGTRWGWPKRSAPNAISTIWNRAIPNAIRRAG